MRAKRKIEAVARKKADKKRIEKLMKEHARKLRRGKGPEWDAGANRLLAELKRRREARQGN